MYVLSFLLASPQLVTGSSHCQDNIFKGSLACPAYIFLLRNVCGGISCRPNEEGGVVNTQVIMDSGGSGCVSAG